MLDPIPNEGYYEFVPGDEDAPSTAIFTAFNTTIQLQAYGNPACVAAVFDEARASCRRFERLFSRTLPHSDVALLNSARGQRVPIAREAYDLITAALGYCDRSAGVFDITIGPVIALWDFRAKVIPEPAAVASAVQHVDYRRVKVEETADGCFAWLEDPDARIDLGGIAKGFIADALTADFIRAGVSAFVLDLGGNVVVNGMKPDGQVWKVGIRNPRDTRTLLGVLPLEGGSVVTSGIYERGFDRGGQRYHHILDPKTGYPVDTDVAGVSVVSARSIDAEGFSTTLLALGLRRGMEFAQTCPEIITAVFVDTDNVLHQV